MTDEAKRPFEFSEETMRAILRRSRDPAERQAKVDAELEAQVEALIALLRYPVGS
jgi:hypothetical protein